MERRGIRTNRGNINREVEVTNSEIRQLRARINKLKAWLTEESKSTEPSIQDVFASILRGNGSKAYWRRNADLKTASQILIFIQANNIYEMEGLRKTVGNTVGRQTAIGGKLNKMDRRMKTLDEHIRQSGVYAECKPFYDQYRQTKPKKQAAYYETHRDKIVLFEAAERYIKGVMNGRPGLPVREWKTERAKLTAERKTLSQEYFKLKEEVRQAEIIRRNVEDVMREDLRERQPRQRAQNLEL
jgi:hypothetical protein